MNQTRLIQQVAGLLLSILLGIFVLVQVSRPETGGTGVEISSEAEALQQLFSVFPEKENPPYSRTIFAEQLNQAFYIALAHGETGQPITFVECFTVLPDGRITVQNYIPKSSVVTFVDPIACEGR